MINDVARKSIHVDAPNNVPVAQIKEYDDFILKLALMKYNTPFDCTGQTATLGVKAPSGLFEQTTDITINKDQIDIKLKTGIVSKSGICEMELKLVDSTGSMTTASFFIAVNRKILNDEAVEASDEFDSLTEAKKMEPIRQENELKRQENEKGRVEAEKLRGQAETNRAAAETARVEAEKLRVTAEAEREKRLSDVEEKATNNATQIADIVKYQANSNKDYEGVEHENLNARLIADYIMMMDRFNKASLLPYENEFITASNSYEGKTRDNVIKGRTLQNLWDNKSIFNISPDAEGFITGVANGNYVDLSTKNVRMFKPLTLYTIITIVESNTLNGKFNPFIGHLTAISADVLNPIEPSGKGVFIGTITTVSDLTDKISGIRSFIVNDCTEGSIKYKIIALEGDYTSKPIPSYFEGIKSVNEDGENLEEVSCGKNLLDSKKLKEFYNATYELINKDGRECLKPIDYSKWRGNSLPIKFKPNTQYTFKYDVFNETPTEGTGLYFRINYTDGTSSNIIYTASNKWISPSVTSLPNKTIDKIWLTYGVTSSVVYFDLNSFRLNEGTGIVDEPYVEDRLSIKMKNLRSLPNGTCDTSDGVRRVEKIIIDGSQDIKLQSINNNNLSNFYVKLPRLGTSVAICDKLLLDNTVIASAIKEGFIISNSDTLYIRLLSNKASTVEQAKLYFKNNPHTFYYELAEPIKEEGNKEELRTYDGITNIFTEGSLIEPTISVKIPSNVQAVVMNLRSENKTLNNDVNTLQATTEENNLMNIETNVNQEARLTMLELGVI